MPGRSLKQPWIGLQGQQDQVRATHSNDEIAILLTGDGGWAGLDQELAADLAACGVSTGVPLLCIYGEGESDSICPGLPRAPEHTQITLAEIGKGHHFSGEYATLAERILAFARSAHPVT